jgi:hypothetical protein
MPSFIHLIFYLFIYVWDEQLFALGTIHYLFNYLIETIVVIWMIIAWFDYLFNYVYYHIIVLCKKNKIWKKLDFQLCLYP